ncbi:LADA_0H18382g1_1 [Lachancea dasiensis]|uniref:LADA_0H18382g1_1 n=1 Tax=Lachancea dasiensis TaxID=1072105 RepID=A0A1G4K5V5_9SACH|nr:LADA_0H18382g1_1 [Lachancea dasiensis]
MTFENFLRGPTEPRTVPQEPPVEQYRAASSYLDLFSQKGKLVVVTGAAGAIGGAICEGFASAGADLCLVDYRYDQALAENLSAKYGIQAKAYQVDITKAQDVQTCVRAIQQDFEGRDIDTFIANAGVAWTHGGILNETATPEAWQRVMDVNVQGTFHCSKYIAEVFKLQGHGCLILTASMSSHIANVPNYQTCYNASKAAVRHMARGFAVEFAHLTEPAGRIRCNSVSPGYTDTILSSFVPTEQRAQWWGLTPQGREALPQELVGAYLYLASDAASFTNGCDISVDGGYTCV